LDAARAKGEAVAIAALKAEVVPAELVPVLAKLGIVLKK